MSLLKTAKSLLYYVKTYGGEVTSNIEAAIPMYQADIEAAEAQESKLLAALDKIGGQAYDAEAYGEDEMRVRLVEIRRLVREVLNG